MSRRYLLLQKRNKKRNVLEDAAAAANVQNVLVHDKRRARGCSKSGFKKMLNVSMIRTDDLGVLGGNKNCSYSWRNL